MSVPMVYPTYGLDEDSHAPCTEIKVDPLVEKNIDNDLNDQEVCDEDFDEEFKDPNWNLSKGKKPSSPMEPSLQRGNQRVN